MFQKVQAAINQVAAEVGHKTPIRLLVSQESHEARAAGSWRRHYILLGPEIIEKVAADLENPTKREKARALLLHEIGHLYHRDVQRIGYTRQLLRHTAILLPWWMLFLSGWLGFALTMGEAFLAFDLQAVEGVDPMVAQTLEPLLALSPADRAEIAEKTRSISVGLMLNFIVNALFPIAVIALVLWLFFWRRLVRMQEYYADGLVREQGIGWASLAGAMGRYPAWVRPARPAPSNPLEHLRRWPVALLRPLKHLRSQSSPFSFLSPTGAAGQIRKWFALHPTFHERMAHFRDDTAFVVDWRSMAWPTAVLVIALDVMLITPFISYHTAGYPVHISTLAIFLLISTWMLPLMILRKSLRKTLLKIGAVIFGLRWAWLLLNVLLLLSLAFAAPANALELINLIINSGSRIVAADAVSVPQDPLTFVLSIIPGLIGLQLLQVVAAALLLLLYWWLQRIPLQADRSVDWARRHWGTVFALSVLILALFLTPLSDLINGEPQRLWQPERLASYAGGLLVAAAVWFWISRAEAAENA